MKITKSQNGNNLTVALEGRLDTNTAPELENVLKNSLDGITELTIDMAATTCRLRDCAFCWARRRR